MHAIFSGASIAELSGYQGNWHGRTRLVIEGTRIKGLRQHLWQRRRLRDRRRRGRRRLEAACDLRAQGTAHHRDRHLQAGRGRCVHAAGRGHAETNNRRQRESYVCGVLPRSDQHRRRRDRNFGLEPVAGAFRRPAARRAAGARVQLGRRSGRRARCNSRRLRSLRRRLPNGCHGRS